MRRCARIATGVGLLCAWLALIGPSHGAAEKKKAGRPAAAGISPALRAASLRKVSSYLEDPPSEPFAQSEALDPALKQLFRLASRQPDPPPVHIIQFGDSHTAADDFTGGVRDRLKDRFGDGGSGFSLAGHPFRGYRRFDVRGGGTPLWRSEGLRAASGDGFFGLGGVSISTAQAGQSVFIETDCSHLDVDYQIGRASCRER